MVNCEHETPNKTNGVDINKLYSIRANKNVDGMTFKEALRYVHHNEFNGVKINGYAKISSVLQAKYALLNGPIIGGFPVYNTDTYFFIRRGCESMQGGHAVTIVGYDDDKKEFKIQNSWGTRWGKNGYTTLKYDEFPEVCFEAWCILP